MDNPETRSPLSTRDRRRRQTRTIQKTKKMSITDPTKHWDVYLGVGER